MANENKEQLLDSIKGQIAAFDNKASILLTTFGILIGLVASSFFACYSDITKIIDPKVICWIKTSFYAFFISGFFPLIFSILAIYPRKDPLREKDDINYYWEIASMSLETYTAESNKENPKKNLLESQIWKNSKIAKTKHILVALTIWSTIPFGLAFGSAMVAIVYALFI